MSEDQSSDLRPDASATRLGRADAQEDRWLGMRLRALRRERKLSIRTLAERSGLSGGMISQIERAQSTPSIRSLRVLGMALDVPISWFFTAPSEEEASDSTYIIRRGHRRLLRLTSEGVMKELLTPTTPGLLEMYEITLAAGGTSGDEFYQHKQGEKTGVILEGALQLFLQSKAFILNEGDSFRFPSHLAHRFGNPGRTTTRIIWIITPPVVEPTDPED